MSRHLLRLLLRYQYRRLVVSILTGDQASARRYWDQATHIRRRLKEQP